MNTTLYDIIKEERDKGKTWGQIANKVNSLGYRKKTGVNHCEKSVSLILIEKDPNYRSYNRKAKRKYTRRSIISTTPNEIAIDLILSNKSLNIKDRLEIAMKLL